MGFSALLSKRSQLVEKTKKDWKTEEKNAKEEVIQEMLFIKNK